MLDKLTIKLDDNWRDGVFHASDYGKSIYDIYCSFKEIEPTNPVQWYDTLKWGAGLGVEDKMLQVLKDSGVVQEDYDQNVHGGGLMEREGVKITYHMDAVTKEGLPIEIKSINNKNAFDIRSYEENTPRESYVGQLSTYMDALGVDKGYLFVASIDGLHRFWLECKHIKDRLYQCGTVTVDLDKHYNKLAKLYNENIVKDIEPEPDIIYKYDVKEIDWKTISKNEISKARNGHKVIGDWQVLYSPYKNRIIEKQGETLGYTNDELSYILEQTSGYTTWNK